MGEIYRAQDTWLGRVVAVQIYKEEFSDRATREACAMAALNHRKIWQLYDVGATASGGESVDIPHS